MPLFLDNTQSHGNERRIIHCVWHVTWRMRPPLVTRPEYLIYSIREQKFSRRARARGLLYRMLSINPTLMLPVRDSVVISISRITRQRIAHSCLFYLYLSFSSHKSVSLRNKFSDKIFLLFTTGTCRKKGGCVWTVIKMSSTISDIFTFLLYKLKRVNIVCYKIETQRMI